MPLNFLDRYLLCRDLRGLAGFAADVVNIARLEFRNPHGLIKFYVIDNLRRRTGAETFIEAGTYLGTTAGRCSRVFKRVFTVEIDPCLASRSRQFLSQFPNVSTLEGDAQKIVPEIIAAHE